MKKVILLAILASIFAIIIGCGGDDVVNIDEDIIVVLYPDTTVTVHYNEPYQFFYLVLVTTDTAVTWYVNDVEGGNDSLGTIDSTGTYLIAPNYTNFDEVWIKVVSQADPTKYDTAKVVIKESGYVHVDTSGSDDTGKGTIANPYRTITKGLENANQDQQVVVHPGLYSEADGESFPLVPRIGVSIRGAGVDSTIVQAPSDSATFRFEYEGSLIRNLSIRGVNKLGTGIKFSATQAGIHVFTVRDVEIENVHTAAIKAGQADSIAFEDNTVNNCVYGIVVDQPASRLDLDDCVFSNIDSTAILLISPISINMDFSMVTVSNANIGLDYAAGSSGLVSNSTFSDIDSSAIIIHNLIDLVSGGANDFSGCSNWCLMNLWEDLSTVDAHGNIWPSTDSTTIDTQYIYDDDENSNVGVVDFMPLGL